ncbi:MAG: hypothetical protein WDN24_11945 [Sphingomonas sp.]
MKGGDLGYEAGVAAGGPIVADRLGLRASVYYRATAAGSTGRAGGSETTGTRTSILDCLRRPRRAALGAARLAVGDAEHLLPGPQVQRSGAAVDELPGVTGSPLNPTMNRVRTARPISAATGW